MEVQAESTAPVEATEVDSKVAETPGEGSAPSGTEAAASGDDTSSWTEKAQKRYDELTRERYEAAARADREAYRREQLERELQELRAKIPAKTETVAPSSDFPTLESVGYDETKHAVAVAEWSAKQAREAAKAELAAEREAANRENAVKTWRQREAELIKSKPDYVDKVQRARELPITAEAQRALMNLEEGPQLALYLVENRDKAEAIMRLPIEVQMMELGRISATLAANKAAAAAKPPVSQAPAPPPKIDTAEAASHITPDSPDSDTKWSAEEWARRRNKQVEKRRS
jgi:hypothetical protein